MHWGSLAPVTFSIFVVFKALKEHETPPENVSWY